MKADVEFRGIAHNLSFYRARDLFIISFKCYNFRVSKFQMNHHF